MRLLVVDDSPDIAALLKMAFSAEFRASVAQSCCSLPQWLNHTAPCYRAVGCRRGNLVSEG